MIVFISAAATERQMVAAASKSLPDGFPAVQALDSGKLQSDAEIGILLADVGAAPCVFVVRVLGGKRYFERGFARLREFCRERNRYLIALPGDQNPDAELDAISNIPLAVAAKAFQYALASGVENYRNLLRYLSDVFLSTSIRFRRSRADARRGALSSGRRRSRGLREPEPRGIPASLLAGTSARHRNSVLSRILAERRPGGRGRAGARDRSARLQRPARLLLQPARRVGKAASANIFSRYFVNDAGTDGQLRHQPVQLRRRGTAARRENHHGRRSDGGLFEDACHPFHSSRSLLR